MKYDYVTISTIREGWRLQMDQHGEVGFRMVNWLPWDGNHVIIMERARES